MASAAGRPSFVHFTYRNIAARSLVDRQFQTVQLDGVRTEWRHVRSFTLVITEADWKSMSFVDITKKEAKKGWGRREMERTSIGERAGDMKQLIELSLQYMFFLVPFCTSAIHRIFLRKLLAWRFGKNSSRAPVLVSRVCKCPGIYAVFCFILCV